MDEDEAKVALIIFGCVALCVAVIVFLVTYRSETNAQVVQLSWSRAIDIQQYKTVQESDWSVPQGGRETRRYEEIHHWERYVSGSHEECTGTGTKQTCETEYDYSSRPVWATKYDYDIDRWVTIRTPERHGVGTAPAWPDVSDLKEGTALGSERAGARYSRYTVGFTQGYSLDMTQERWQNFAPGQKVVLVLNIFKQALNVH